MDHNQTCVLVVVKIGSIDVSTQSNGNVMIPFGRHHPEAYGEVCEVIWVKVL